MHNKKEVVVCRNDNEDNQNEYNSVPCTKNNNNNMFFFNML